MIQTSSATDRMMKAPTMARIVLNTYSIPQGVLDRHDGFRLHRRASQTGGVRLTCGDASAIQHLRSSGVFLSGQNNSDLNQILVRTRLGADCSWITKSPSTWLNASLACAIGIPPARAQMSWSLPTSTFTAHRNCLVVNVVCSFSHTICGSPRLRRTVPGRSVQPGAQFGLLASWAL